MIKYKKFHENGGVDATMKFITKWINDHNVKVVTMFESRWWHYFNGIVVVYKDE